MQGHIHKRVHTCDDGRVSTLWYVVVDLPAGRRRQAATEVARRLSHQEGGRGGAGTSGS